jgi:hypothetical protein
MRQAAIRPGPGDHGQAMSRGDFEHAEGQEGHLYERERAIVIVADVPTRRRPRGVNAQRRQLSTCDQAHAGLIDSIAAGSVCKVLVEESQSERHPGMAVCRTPPPGVDAGRGVVLVLKRRRGTWTERVVKPSERSRSAALPGFVLDVRAVFGAAG